MNTNNNSSIRTLPEINYIKEAENDDIILYSIGIPDYISKGFEGVINVLVPNKNKPTIEQVLHSMKLKADKIVNMHESNYGKFIRTIKISNTQQFLKAFRGSKGKTMYNNFEVLKIRKIIEDMKKGFYRTATKSDFGIKEDRADFLVVESNAISLKVPTKFIYQDGSQPTWDYDYLLYPIQNMDLKLFRMSQEILDDIANSLTDTNLAKKVRELTIPTDLELFNTFTWNRYEISRIKYREVAMKTKAFINLIMEEELYDETDSEFFGVYQQSRMAKKNKASYTHIKYESTYSEDGTFPKMFRDYLGKDKSEAKEIPLPVLQSMIDSMDIQSIEYNDLQAIYLYCQAKQKYTQEEIINTYEKLENQRESIRFELFTSNLGFVGNLNTLFSIQYSLYAKAKISYLAHSYQLGDKLQPANDVKLEFQTKAVSITEGKDKTDSDGIQNEGIKWLTMEEGNNDAPF